MKKDKWAVRTYLLDDFPYVGEAEMGLLNTVKSVRRTDGSDLEPGEKLYSDDEFKAVLGCGIDNYKTQEQLADDFLNDRINSQAKALKELREKVTSVKSDVFDIKLYKKIFDGKFDDIWEAIKLIVVIAIAVEAVNIAIICLLFV